MDQSELSDSPQEDAATKPLNPAFKEAVFELSASGMHDDFWVITAYNPDSKDTDVNLNKQADEKLREEITTLGKTPFRVIGRSRDGSHAEPGWGAQFNETTAIELGRQFRQDAVFHFKAGEIWLVDCADGKRVALENPKSRIFGLG